MTRCLLPILALLVGCAHDPDVVDLDGDGSPASEDCDDSDPRVSPAAFAGCSVAGLGDVDGDGYGEVLVGSYGDDTSGYGSGAALVVYGSGL